MTTAFAHILPWTEDEYLALDRTSSRVELFDGSLHVSPAPTYRHQAISRRLTGRLVSPVEAVGLDVVEAVNLRLRQGRITIPDLVVTELPDLDTNVLDAEMIWLVCEITSPSNAATDRLLKMRYYATAGIEWYLVVEQDDLILRLHHLDNGRYVEHSVAKPGEPLQLPSPIDVQIDPADLLPPIRSSVTPLS